MELREPDSSLREAFQRMAESFRAAGEARHREACGMDETEFTAYVARLRAAARGEGLPRGQVPEVTWWAVESGEIAGVARLRPRLDPLQERLAGHVGFELAPAYRTERAGRSLLALALDEARAAGLTDLLLCCDPESSFRRQVIEACGGALLDEVRGLLPEGDAYRKVRYRVRLPETRPSPG